MAGEQFSAMTNTAPLVRLWRTAFLTLRDETSSHPTATLSSVIQLLDELVFAHFHSFVTAAASLPSHEVTSDMMYLMKLAASSCGDENMERVLSLICHLVHNITLRVALDLSPPAWSEMLGSFSKVTKFFIKDAGKRQLSENSVAIKAILDCLESTRHLIGVEPRRSSILENNTVVEFLLHTIICCHSELNGYGPSREDVRFSNASRNRFDQQSSLLKVQTTAFSMVDEAFSRVGSSFSIEMWQSIVEVLRKVMDSLAAKTFPSENGTLSRFYTSLLRCLHTVLVNRKDSVSDHLAAFIAALKMFLGYGLNNSSLISRQIERDPASSSPKFNSAETVKKVVGAYRPPHLRGRNRSSLQQTFTQTLSDHDSSPVEFSSSDSDYSDSDGSLKDTTHICKARVAAITCIQDLCEADPKAFIAQWTMLLPTSDALQPRKYEATLMTCLLYDPFLKVRLASASTIAAMLEGPSPAALQFAEYKESSKCGSFTALSSSLGQILMQLHAGVLYLIEHEKHSGLLTSLFKILTLLISSTPYSRMPGELLPRVLSSLKLKIEEGFPQQRDQTSFLAVAISCLTASVSTTPPSLHVNEILQVEISTGLCGGKGGSGILTTLILYAEKVTNTTLCLEALQALKAFCHNYPTIMALCWKQISSLVYNFLKPDTFVFPSLKGAVGRDIGSTVDKVVSGAVKVLDECLRAVSGFKGTEDLFGDGLMESPFASEFVRDKKISSAPSYGSGSVGISNDNLSGIREWSEALDKHIAISIHHASGMVRAASITCFAGITCSVFSSLEKQQQHFILHSCTDGANDLAPSVRSAACRAIGVVACFPEILRRNSSQVHQRCRGQHS